MEFGRLSKKEYRDATTSFRKCRSSKCHRVLDSTSSIELSGVTPTSQNLPEFRRHLGTGLEAIEEYSAHVNKSCIISFSYMYYTCIISSEFILDFSLKTGQSLAMEDRVTRLLPAEFPP